MTPTELALHHVASILEGIPNTDSMVPSLPVILSTLVLRRAIAELVLILRHWRPKRKLVRKLSLVDWNNELTSLIWHRVLERECKKNQNPTHKKERIFLFEYILFFWIKTPLLSFLTKIYNLDFFFRNILILFYYIIRTFWFFFNYN